MRDLTPNEITRVSGGSSVTIPVGSSRFYTGSSGSVGGETGGYSWGFESLSFDIFVHPLLEQGGHYWDWPFLTDGRTFTDQFEDTIWGIGEGLLTGAVYGALGGAVVGSVAGPEGILPGAGAGALGGSIVGMIQGGVDGFCGKTHAPWNEP